MTSRQEIAACILVYGILSLSIADWASTVYGLEMGTFQEGNPIMAAVFAMDYWLALVVKLVPGLVATIGCFVAARSERTVVKAFLASLTFTVLLCAVPVVWNTAWLIRMGG